MLEFPVKPVHIAVAFDEPFGALVVVMEVHAPAAAPTVRLTVGASAEFPTEFAAIRVYVVTLDVAVGVPEITQVVAATESPEGSAVVAALIAQAVILAPFAVKVDGVTDMALATVPEVPVDLL